MVNVICFVNNFPATFFLDVTTTAFSRSDLVFFAVIMEARGDDEVADDQNIQLTNANACPCDSRDEMSNGICALCV